MTSLIIDIASGSVGVAGVLVPRSGRPFVSFVVRERIPIAPTLEPKHFFTATRVALVSVCAHLSTLSHADMPTITRAHIFLHAPWIVSKTRSVRTQFPHPTALSPATLAAIIKDAEHGIAENFHAAYHDIAEAVRTVEKKIIAFRVNGYAVSTALHKEATSFEATLFESFAPEAAVRAFERALDVCSLAPREWHSAAAALAHARAASLGGGEEDAALTISAGAEATEVCLVHRGLLEEVLSIPQGIRSAARAAAASGAFHSAAAAEAFFAMPAYDALAPARREKAGAARRAGAALWRDAVSAALPPALRAGFAPRRAELFAAEEQISFFADAVREAGADTAAASHLFAALAPQGAEAFSADMVAARAAPPDTFLYAEAAFLAAYEAGNRAA